MIRLPLDIALTTRVHVMMRDGSMYVGHLEKFTDEVIVIGDSGRGEVSPLRTWTRTYYIDASEVTCVTVTTETSA